MGRWECGRVEVEVEVEVEVVCLHRPWGGEGGELRRRDGRGCLGLTFVLRSTHSSQLSVGLLRFCFFLAGAWPWAADGAAGLVDEGCEVGVVVMVASWLSSSSSSSRFIVRHRRRGPLSGSKQLAERRGRGCRRRV